METYFREVDAIQREKVKELIHTNMFIEAGAGAGKTSIIVDRVINQLKADFLPSEIVVITFTNAATEEIRGRIISGLSKAIKAENDETIKNKLIDSYKNMYSMNISTIHSFCNKLLSEKCFAAKLPLGLKLIQDEDEKNRRKNYFDVWFNKLTKNDFRVLYSLDKGGIRKTKNNIYTKFNEYVEAGDNLNIVLPTIKDDYFDDALKVALDCFNYIDSFKGLKANNKLVELIELHNKYLADKGKKNFDVFKYQADFINGMKCFIVANNEGIYINNPYDNKPDKNKIINNGIRKYLIDKGILDYIVLNDIYVNGNIAKYAKEAYEYYEKMVKEDRENLSNNQLLSFTNELVKDYGARKYFAKKIKCIYVDEFQDTDMVQSDFIWKLACDTGEDQCEILRDGALFVVGDPKQSIYRFRGADPEVFFDIKEKMVKANNAEVFFFSNNFRSNNEIIDTVNNYYHSINLVNKGLYNNMVVPSNHVVPVKKDKSKELSGAYIMDCVSNPKENAIKIAKLVYKLVNDGYKIPKTIGDKSNGYTFKNIEYEDIAIIMGKHDDMQKYIDELNKLGISVKTYGEVLPRSEAILTVYLRLLRSIIYKNDYMSDFGALEALRFSGINYPKEFTQEIEVEEYYRNILKSIKSKFNGMSSYARAYSLAKHLEYILPKNENVLAGNVISIQTKLQQMLENNFKDNFLNGVELIESIENYASSKLKSELSIIDNRAVRLMNVHQAKGLEGEIIIYANNDKDCSFKTKDYRQGKTYYPVVSYIHNSNTTILDRAKLEHDLETNRLEYVAITRAKQVIIFDNDLKKNQLFKREETNYGLDNLKRFNFNLEVNNEHNMEVVDPYIISCDNAKNIELSKPLYIKINPSSKDNSISKKREEARKKVSDIEKYQNNRPTGAALGTILHRAFELLVKRYNKVDNISVFVNQAIDENKGIFSQKEYCKYNFFISACVKAYKEYLDNNKILSKYSKVSAEMPYSYYDKESNTWTNGTMDLLLVNPNKDALVIDYKSDVAEYIEDDSLFEETLKEKYEEQVEAYKAAVNRLFNIDIKNITTKIIYIRRYNKDSNSVDIKELVL